MSRAELDDMLLRLLWSDARWISGGFDAEDGRRIEVEAAGEICGGAARAVRIAIDGRSCSGSVMLGGRNVPSDCIACFVTSGPVPDAAGELPTVRVAIPDAVRRSCNRLRSGAKIYGCGERLREMTPVDRTELLTQFYYDRIVRKYSDIDSLFKQCRKEWEQTFYVMLFRVMGDVNNRDAYTELARRVPYSALRRYGTSERIVEALLLCASGLLDRYEEDDYIRSLKGEFAWLGRFYGIEPMHPREWTLDGVNPRNHPVLRLSQLAALIRATDFLPDSVLACRTVNDVRKLFSAEASDYWTSHYVPARNSDRSVKRIGAGKADLLGINFVVPMQYYYGSMNCKEDLRRRAIDLLDSIPAEDNRFIRGWRGEGVPVHSALDTQALLQIRNEYCAAQRCCECRLGRQTIKNALR